MQIFASTTFMGPDRTRASDVVRAVQGLPLDGLELGSTHVMQCQEDARAIRELWPSRLLTHNFFPPAADELLVLNMAAVDKDVRSKSLKHYRYCLEFAGKLGAEIYTVHPGFMTGQANTTGRKGTSYYDFEFGIGRVPHDVAFSAMLDGLGELIDHARAIGVILALETEGSFNQRGVLLMERPEEYERLFSALPDIRLNFNLAHTRLSSRVHGFAMEDFISRFGERFAAVELSHNDGVSDQHETLTPESYVLDWVERLPDVPWILEFRNATVSDLLTSAALLRDMRKK